MPKGPPSDKFGSVTHRIINFYEFVELDALHERRAAHRLEGTRLGLTGTIQLAPEGLNVALSGEQTALEAYIAFVRADPRLAGVTPKWSTGESNPFHGLHVKVKGWIIRFSDDEPVPVEAIRAGARIDAEAFRALLRESRDDVVVVDTRNLYETEYGRFAGAESLALDRFTQFPEAFLSRYGDRRDRTYVLYCTGGVRCEKAVAWAGQQGFDSCYQLDGGVLGYFDRCGGEGWEGSCFVFDQRWLVDAQLAETDDEAAGIDRLQPKPSRADPVS